MAGKPLTATLGALAVFALAATAAGCDESVNPILESDRRYTLFATLDMNTDTQMLRVIPIRETIFGDASALDVEVRSVDLMNGLARAWRDSVVTFPDGPVGHVFVTTLRIEPHHRYRIEVVEPDGTVATTVETTVPARPEPQVFPEQIRVSPAGFIGTQRLVWHDLPRYPFTVTYWYRFYSYRGNRFEDVLMPHVPGNARSSTDPNDWEFFADLTADRSVLDEEHSTWRVDPLAGIGMTVTILDDAFVPPGGKFDRAVLSQPGTFSNVEGGFGYVGSVGRFSIEWVLADASARLLGYNPLGGALKAELEAIAGAER